MIDSVIQPNTTSLSAEIERLRGLIDRQNIADREASAVLTRLAALAARAAELRQRTNEDILRSVTRCETLLANERVRYRSEMRALRDSLDPVRQRAAELSDAAASVASEFSTALGTSGPASEKAARWPSADPSSGPVSRLILDVETVSGEP